MRHDSTQQLPCYRCHKEVQAVKIKEIVYHAHPDPDVSIPEFAATDEFAGGHIFPEGEGLAPIPFDAEFYRRHHPFVGGYYVVYADGYASFSPAPAFEAGYTAIQ